MSEYCGSGVKISTDASANGNLNGFQMNGIASPICCEYSKSLPRVEVLVIQHISFLATRLPFEVSFYSDGFEFAEVESLEAQAGVKLSYQQDGDTC